MHCRIWCNDMRGVVELEVDTNVGVISICICSQKDMS